MRRLIIVSGAAACGSLRESRISERVEMITDRFVWGPVPLSNNDPTIFNAQRLAIWGAVPDTSDQPEVWTREYDVRRFEWSDHITRMAEYDRIELWMDPDVNAQLQLLYLLSWFGSQADLSKKIFIAQIEQPLGEKRPYEHRIRPPEIFQVSRIEFALAAQAWDAFRQPTPQTWYALLAHDLNAIAGLRRTVLDMLAELPSVSTGLRESEQKLLELIKEDGASPRSVMANIISPVFEYWELGRLLNSLGKGQNPAITGILDVSFDLALHNNVQLFDVYMSNSLKLSAFGKSLLHGDENIIRKVPFKFWWGGTLITSERAWCWNAQEKALSLT